jgi:hypothetical protein
MDIRLQHVRFVPNVLEPGVLYVAKELGAAAHLCACGCGSKVRTPLGPTDWVLRERKGKPTLHPSIGNWQLPCRSHYWIRAGKVVWAERWSDEEIEEGRRAEQDRNDAYYGRQKRGRRWWRFWS